MTYNWSESRLKEASLKDAEMKFHVQFSGYIKVSETVGVDWGVGPPVPIPNTEVKHTFADNTLRVTAREDR